MKTKITILSLILFSLLFSCKKDGSDSLPQNTENVPSLAKKIVNNTKGDNVVMYGLLSRSGHRGADCNYKCIDGIMHRDCWGSGSYCPLQGSIISPIPMGSFSTKSNFTFTAIAQYPEDFSDEETLLIPNRSFFIEEDGTYLNMPEQILVRDSESNCFIFNNLSVTKVPLFVNL